MRRSILLCLLLVALLLTSCGNVEYHNKKADDDISKAIYEAVGEDVYYLGKEETSKGVWHYEYLIWEEREDLLQDVVSVMNETIENERITEKVNVLFLYELPGGDGCAVRLCNYSDDELIHPDCMGLQRMIIVGKDYEYDGDYYNNPNSYITIPDIKYLSVCSSIHERAIAEGIDWQENWPDLEYLEVDCNHTYYVLNADDAISLAIDEELGDTVIYHRKCTDFKESLYYEYLVKRENNDLFYNLVTAVNEAIEADGITQKIDIYVGYEKDGGYEPIAYLSNYSDDELISPDYTRLQRLEIMGKGGDDGSTYLYNDPIVYTAIPDIKCLKVTNLIKERAEAEGIDWYEYWPELESVEVFE